MQNIGPDEISDSQLLNDSALLATIIETVHTGIALLDPQGRFVYVNQAYCDIQGFTAAQLIGRPYTDMIAFAKEQSYLLDIHDAVFHGLTVRPHEVQVRRPDRRDIWTEISCKLVSHGERRYCLISSQDITERKQLEQGLQSLATTDSLTGIANRRHFFEMSRLEMIRAKRTQKTPAILMIDLDNFKLLNDTHGHAAGDRVLINFAAICQAELRESDIFGRLGGEEFAVLLPETNLKLARRIAERLRKSFAAAGLKTEANAPNYTLNSETRCTASIGIARVAESETSVEPAVHRADRALYAAKAAGRNRVILSDSSGG